jgi:hypothetical protein
MATKPRANTAAADATVVFKAVSSSLCLFPLVEFWRWFSWWDFGAGSAPQRTWYAEDHFAIDINKT